MTESQLTGEVAGLKQLLANSKDEVADAMEAVLLASTDADAAVAALVAQNAALADVLAERAEWRTLLADYEAQLEALAETGED